MVRRTILLLWLICAATAPFARAADTTLHFRLTEDPETLYNVKTVSLTANTVIGWYMLERLIYFDDSGKPQPWLATSWMISPDQKIITFKLRDDVTFSDGSPFNAAAVKFLFDTIMDKSNASPLLSRLGSLKTVETPDSATVVFTFDKPYAPFFSYLAGGSFGFNSPSAVKKYGDHYGRTPVGTGPYMLKSWVPGTELTFVRNPNFVQHRADALNKATPYASTIVLTVISEESVAQAALESGELTAASVAADALDELLRNPDLSSVIKKVVTNLYFVEFDEMRPPFDQKDAREAISLAINRDAVVKAAFNGYASPSSNPLANGIPGYDPSIGETYGPHYDPAKAKSLLAGLGYKPGPDGKLAKDGKALILSLKSYAGSQVINNTLSIIQSNLADIGIGTRIETADWSSFYPSLLKHDWDIELMRWTSSDPSVLSVLLRSPGHRNHLLPDPVADPILDRCDTLMDQAARNGCIGEAQKALLDNATIAPVGSDWYIVITQKNVKDYHLDYFNNLLPGDVRAE